MEKQLKRNRDKEKVGLTNIVVILKFSVFILPLLSYLIFIVFVFPAPNSGFIFMGVVGSFLVGLSLIDLVGLLNKTNLGHIITIIPLGLGALLILISSLILYTPTIYSKIDEHYVSLYFLIWTMLVISLIWYLFFHHAISLNIRGRGVAKSEINRKLKGIKNYWWYDSIHRIYGLGWIYYLNKFYTILYLLTAVVHLLLGWWKVISPIIALSVSCLLLANVPMWGITISAQEQIRTPDRKISLLSSLVGFLFPAACSIAVVVYFFKMW